MQLTVSLNKLNPNPYWSNPISQEIIPSIEQTELFDQNGYDLTPLERLYAEANDQAGRWHRPNHYALKRDWFIDEKNSVTGAHINHALLFERKGYAGAALAQLEGWAQHNTLIYKIIKMRPKWGMDISVDYVDTAGNVFELLHWEYDGFDYQEITDKKTQIESIEAMTSNTISELKHQQADITSCIDALLGEYSEPVEEIQETEIVKKQKKK